ncbi:uncharacterized protein GLRG_08719 [Colletotrichum graminicola M1.001]|uniref:Uncharacterized protein n=1 Tax=Colletotrichum graminicola (strain M1.001 / M2 / FGSC 10212) TaxID=645133 RepID=E3QRF2_COLGM|nr:uncharacterized protein GLRG_08719 [Colletotrichum graminicola M1.001]EFQ33440.1 hypothetical protein GLRG_08719 [Colletotrichum graminicola M1.001]
MRAAGAGAGGRRRYVRVGASPVRLVGLPDPKKCLVDGGNLLAEAPALLDEVLNKLKDNAKVSGLDRSHPLLLSSEDDPMGYVLLTRFKELKTSLGHECEAKEDIAASTEQLWDAIKSEEGSNE